MTMKKILRTTVAFCLLACLLVSMIACAKQEPDETDGSEAEKISYSIEVKSAGGMALANVGVYIYTDSTLEELVWFAKTDETGLLTFADAASNSYVAVLKDVPDGYQAAESYALTGETTQIVLEPNQEPGNLASITYHLGDVMQDFTVTASDGTEYTLSQLLSEKKAVVLNFWFMSCQPCQSEFPFLEQAYEKFSDQVAVLALNPVDTDAEAIDQFRGENGLTFPMAPCDPAWENAMQLTGYPTTVVVDRYGTISLIHSGSIPQEQTFANIFAYFADENYQQGTVENVESLPVYEVPTDPTDPSESNDPVTESTNPTTEPTSPTSSTSPTSPTSPTTEPTEPPTVPKLDTSVGEVVEIYGDLTYDVTVEPYKTVYCDWYIRTDMILTIKDSDACVIYNGKTYEAQNGKVSLTVKSEGTNAPVRIGFGNLGSSEKTFTVTLTNIPGSWMNPYTLNLGSFDVTISSENEQGLYYDYQATESGTLTILFVSVTPKVEYVGSFQNMTANTSTNLEYNFTTVSVEVKKGETVRFIIGVLPENSNKSSNYTLKLEASFTTG